MLRAQRVLQTNGEAAASAMGSGPDFEQWIKHGSQGPPASAGPAGTAAGAAQQQ